MIRPRTLLLGLALLLAVPETALAQRGHGRGGGGGRKNSGLFGGAKLRLVPPGRSKAIDPKEVMRKVKELQTKSTARNLGQTERTIGLADGAQLRAWFTTADYNENGWVSFSESAASMSFTRGRFQIFDTDRDGRLLPKEFQDYYMHSIVRSGTFTKPRAKKSTGPPPQRTPEQVRAAYDTDLDSALGELELAQLLEDYQQAQADPVALLDALDKSGDRRLTLDELDGLHEILYPTVATLVDAPDADGPASVLELFGDVIPRPSETGAVPSPPRIQGPVAAFHRLDIDRDGYISVSDLETLLRPSRIGLRPHAVINTLDTDGDMRLSEEEFLGTLVDVDR